MNNGAIIDTLEATVNLLRERLTEMEQIVTACHYHIKGETLISNHGREKLKEVAERIVINQPHLEPRGAYGKNSNRT